MAIQLFRSIPGGIHLVVHSEASWLADPLWSFVGNLAQILSLLALGFAVFEIIRLQRRVEPVVWGLDIVGTSVDNRSRSFHLVDFYNAGTGTAQIVYAGFANANAFQTDGNRYQSVMGSGDRVSMLLTAEAIEKAWFLIGWRSEVDSSVVHYRWFPFVNSGPLYENWTQSIDRTVAAKRWNSRRKREAVRPVGPGFYSGARVKMTIGNKSLDQSLDVIFSGSDQVASPLNPWSSHSRVVPANLPFVDLRG